MPQVHIRLAVTGVTRPDAEGVLLVLTHRLDGLDTFLTGTLEIDKRQLTVRIMTLDDVTVLHPVGSVPPPEIGPTWTGLLDVSHGQRSRVPPQDLVAAARERGRSLAELDSAELRYALTFLEEATTPKIRSARIDAIVNALTQALEAHS